MKKRLTFLLRIGVVVAEIGVVADVAIAVADRVRVVSVQNGGRAARCHVGGRQWIDAAGRRILAGHRLTQGQDFDARELAHAVLEYLVGFG